MTKNTKVPPNHRGTRCDTCRAWFRSSQRKPGQRCLFIVSTGCMGTVWALKPKGGRHGEEAEGHQAEAAEGLLNWTQVQSAHE